MDYKNVSLYTHAKEKIDNIPNIGDYCITGADHKCKTDHCFSTFHLWRLVKEKIDNKEIEIWKDMGWVFPENLLNIMKNTQYFLYSGKETQIQIETGEKIELEFRIARNGSSFNLSGMPGKPSK